MKPLTSWVFLIDLFWANDWLIVVLTHSGGYFMTIEGVWAMHCNCNLCESSSLTFICFSVLLFPMVINSFPNRTITSFFSGCSTWNICSVPVPESVPKLGFQLLSQKTNDLCKFTLPYSPCPVSTISALFSAFFLNHAALCCSISSPSSTTSCDYPFPLDSFPTTSALQSNFAWNIYV